MSGRKSLVAVWRDAVRDSDLGRTSKLLALVLSTYFNGQGYCWPSQETLAAGASITPKAVQTNTGALEIAGFLKVERSRGRSSHRYVATLPSTANVVRRSEWATANGNASNPERRSSNPERRSRESVESAESGALHAVDAFEGVAANARGVCVGCGEEKRLTIDGHCGRCLVAAVTSDE